MTYDELHTRHRRFASWFKLFGAAGHLAACEALFVAAGRAFDDAMAAYHGL